MKSQYPRWRYVREYRSHLFWVRNNLWVVEVHEWPDGSFSVGGCSEPDKTFNTLPAALRYGEKRALDHQWEMAALCS